MLKQTEDGLSSLSGGAIAAKLHVTAIPLRLRVIAYLAILSGYFFYCYNFLLPGYVRPYLISQFGQTLNETAGITAAQNIGVTIGSLVSATVIARRGKRWTAAVIAIGSGVLTLGCLFVESGWGWILLRGGVTFFLGGYYVAAVSMTVALFPQAYRARLQALNSGMFSCAEIGLGALGAIFGDTGWMMLIWAGGLPPLLIALLIFRFVPDDRNIVAYGEEKDQDQPEAERRQGSWAEMLSPFWRRYTFSCVVMAGTNFTGYQLFSEFVTLYLRQERSFDAVEIGLAFSLIGLGSFIGGFFWAWISDRHGRRMPSYGFFGAAVAIGAFLTVPHNPGLIKTLGFIYGFCLSCTYPWGIWFTEIYPARLRSYAAALLHGGHIISIIAPFGVSLIAGHYGIGAGMALAPVVFVAGAILWQTLPETVRASRGFRGWDCDRRPAEIQDA